MHNGSIKQRAWTYPEGQGSLLRGHDIEAMTKDEQKLPGQAEIERCSRQREQHVQRHRVREELDILRELREGQNDGSSEKSEQR